MNLRSLLAAVAALAASTDAFSVNQMRARRAAQRPTTLSPLYSSTMGSFEQGRQQRAGPMTAPPKPSPQQPRRQYTKAEWAAQLDSPDVQSIRTELISKYLALGTGSPTHAAREVDAFLSDPDRSAEFIEMRRHAVEQREVPLGFEDAVMYMGAFMVGVGLDLVARLLVERVQ